MGSLILTYLPVINAVIDKDTEKILGIDWRVWLLIGLSVFVLTITSVIIRLVIKIVSLESKDDRLERRKKELEVEKLEVEKARRDSSY